VVDEYVIFIKFTFTDSARIICVYFVEDLLVFTSSKTCLSSAFGMCILEFLPSQISIPILVVSPEDSRALVKYLLKGTRMVGCSCVLVLSFCERIVSTGVSALSKLAWLHTPDLSRLASVSRLCIHIDRECTFVSMCHIYCDKCNIQQIHVH